jgi:hypothetical protein
MMNRTACPLLLSLALGLAPRAQAQEASWGYGVGLDLVNGRNAGEPATANHLQGRTGSGVEGYVFIPWSASWEGRINVGFDGIRVGSHDVDDPHDGKIQVCEYWRSLRFGLEQTVTLGEWEGVRPYVLLGGGLQETWVRKTNGSLGAASLFAVSWILGGTGGSYNYTQYDSTLDSWNGYLAGGVGARFGDRVLVECRGFWGNHLEFAKEGVTGYGSSPEVNRKGVLIVLTLGIRGN